MARTVDFYTGVLGMQLVKTLELPGGQGQHFFFDMGGGNCLAFFWFPDCPDPVPGVSSPVIRPRTCASSREGSSGCRTTTTTT